MTRRSWVLVVAGAAVLAALLVMVVTGTGVVHLDRWVRDWARAHRDPTLRAACDAFTTVFDPEVDAGLALLAGAVVGGRRRDLRPLLLAGIAVAVTAVPVLALKAGVDRPAPLPHGGDRVLGWFPSGHTASALLFGATVVLLVGPARRAWWALGGFTVVMAAALVYLDAHWLSDVLASGGLGIALLQPLRWCAARIGVAPPAPQAGPARGRRPPLGSRPGTAGTAGGDSRAGAGVPATRRG